MINGGDIINKKEKVSFRTDSNLKRVLIHNAKEKNQNLSEYINDLLSLSVSGSDFFMDQIELKESSSELKSELITIRVTPDDYNKILVNSNKANMSMSKYISSAALNPELEIRVFDGLKDFAYQLTKVGINLNQITMLAHQGKIKEVYVTDAKETLNSIWSELEKLTNKKNK
jgi:predicted HicB family RNase H-like nuclease